MLKNGWTILPGKQNIDYLHVNMQWWEGWNGLKRPGRLPNSWENIGLIKSAKKWKLFKWPICFLGLKFSNGYLNDGSGTAGAKTKRGAGFSFMLMALGLPRSSKCPFGLCLAFHTVTAGKAWNKKQEETKYEKKDFHRSKIKIII